jgi:hypothetical protein
MHSEAPRLRFRKPVKLVVDVPGVSADAAEHRQRAERREKQLASVMDDARDLRRERDSLTQQAALLHCQLEVNGALSAARANRRSRHEA